MKCSVFWARLGKLGEGEAGLWPRYWCEQLGDLWGTLPRSDPGESRAGLWLSVQSCSLPRGYRTQSPQALELRHGQGKREP